MPSRTSTSGLIDQNSGPLVPEGPSIILHIENINPKNQAHDLYSLTLAKFDQLVDQGEILWADSAPEHAEYDGFKVEFRITPNSILGRKPIHPPDHPSRTKPTASNPFLNPDPRFVVAQVGNSHTLLLNKYCIIRPQSILHTVEFQRQDEPLTEVDLQAAWQVLQAMEDTWRAGAKGKADDEIQRQAIIYNCGAEGGSSQGHRHMQLFPRPDWLFPDHYIGEPVQEGPDIGEVESNFPSVPYKHFVIRLPPNATAVDVIRAYNTLLSYLPSALQANGAQDSGSAANGTRKLPHNVCLVPEWIAVIPRRNARRDGVGANTAGMMGAIWLKDQEERNGWDRLGVREHLAYMGVPK